MLRFVKLFQIYLNQLRIDHSDLCIDMSGTKYEGVARPCRCSKVEVIQASIHEVRMSRLHTQLAILHNCGWLYINDNENHKGLLEERLHNLDSHNLKLTEYEKRFLEKVDSLIVALSTNAIHLGALYHEHGIFPITEDEHQKFVIDSFSFPSKLEAIRNTNPTSKESVENMMIIIKSQ